MMRTEKRVPRQSSSDKEEFTGWKRVESIFDEATMVDIKAKFENSLNESKDDFEVIFQRELVEDNHPNDKKRMQISLKKVLGKELHATVVDKVRVTLKQYFPDHHLNHDGKMVVSLEGCEYQMWHTDFEVKLGPESNNNRFPLSLFVGVSEKSSIDVKPCFTSKKEEETTVTYYSGDMLLLDGFKIHRGHGYSSLNYRMFFSASHKNSNQTNKTNRLTYY